MLIITLRALVNMTHNNIQWPSATMPALFERELWRSFLRSCVAFSFPLYDSSQCTVINSLNFFVVAIQPSSNSLHLNSNFLVIVILNNTPFPCNLYIYIYIYVCVCVCMINMPNLHHNSQGACSMGVQCWKWSHMLAFHK